MRFGYSKKVLELFSHPKNMGRLKDANVTALVGSMACGDIIKLYLKINPKGETIDKIKFESYGCVANIATSSMVTEIVKGEPIKKAEKINFKSVINKLNGLPRIKFHCAVLAVTGLKIAIKKWEYIQGKRKLDRRFIEELLHGVLDPHTERDLVSSKVISDIIINNNNVKIFLNIPNDKFKEEIISNIKEALEKLPIKLKIITRG